MNKSIREPLDLINLTAQCIDFLTSSQQAPACDLIALFHSSDDGKFVVCPRYQDLFHTLHIPRYRIPKEGLTDSYIAQVIALLIAQLEITLHDLHYYIRHTPKIDSQIHTIDQTKATGAALALAHAYRTKNKHFTQLAK